MILKRLENSIVISEISLALYSNKINILLMKNQNYCKMLKSKIILENISLEDFSNTYTLEKMNCMDYDNFFYL